MSSQSSPALRELVVHFRLSHGDTESGSTEERPGETELPPRRTRSRRRGDSCDAAILGRVPRCMSSQSSRRTLRELRRLFAFFRFPPSAAEDHRPLQRSATETRKAEARRSVRARQSFHHEGHEVDEEGIPATRRYASGFPVASRASPAVVLFVSVVVQALEPAPSLLRVSVFRASAEDYRALRCFSMSGSEAISTSPTIWRLRAET